MGFFFEGYTLLSIIGVLILVTSLVLLNDITRRDKKLSILFYCILPVILAILIGLKVVGSPSSKTWFGVIKTYSALIGVIGFMLIRYTKIGKSRFTWYFPVAILGINIIEAIIREIEVFQTYKVLTLDEASGLMMLGGPWNIINAIAGVLLILTMTGWMGIRVSKDKSKDMVWPDQLWFWIIAYDLWNVAYCYNCISTRAMYSGIVLILSCTISEFFIRRGVWLQHRAQTLALFGMFSLAVDYSGMEMFNITATYNPKAWMALSVMSLIVNLAVFIYEIYYIKNAKRNPLKEELYVELSSYKKNLDGI